MHHISFVSRFATTVCAVVFFATLSPIGVDAITPSAIRGADEKNFAHPTSRCLTKTMKNLNASMVKRMQNDIVAVEKRLKKKFGPIFEVPKPQIAEQRICSSEQGILPRLCIVGALAAGHEYKIEFDGFSGQSRDIIIISPVQGGTSSPLLNIQANTAGATTSGSVHFDGISEGVYTAYGFTNSYTSIRESNPSVSLTFAVTAKPSYASSTEVAVLSNKKNPAEIYKMKMDTVWSAMAEPYCGYGSRGITAVKRSYTKSVEHIRAEFLKSVK